jgi:hypothetical protein
MWAVAGGQGKRAGSRRASKPATPWQPALLHAVGITACIVAWGYLVWLAIDFGASARGGESGAGARGGESGAWALLGLATLGAVACLFAALLLGVRLGRVLGVTRDASAPPRASGGRRASR